MEGIGNVVLLALLAGVSGRPNILFLQCDEMDGKQYGRHCCTHVGF